MSFNFPNSKANTQVISKGKKWDDLGLWIQNWLLLQSPLQCDELSANRFSSSGFCRKMKIDIKST